MNMLQSLSGSPAPDNGSAELKDRLITIVKREVKHLMEEAVTKKCIHEESSSVTSLCAAVEACLSHGLRRRALGLFKTSSTTALIQKIAKVCPDAQYISRRLIELDIAHGNTNVVSVKRASCSSDSIIKPSLLNKGSSSSVTGINTVSSASCLGSTTTNSTSNLPAMKYLWIRLALYEKRLTKIIEHLVNNASSYYDRDALVADADYGSILSSLLVGPCALEFTHDKAMDHYSTDQNADELMQRHRISSGNRTPPTSHRPIINFKRSLNTSSEDTSSCSYKPSSPANVAKDYVESLHQNSKTILLYGKNNVLVLPKDVGDAMPGYLSLHQNVQSLIIKWTPNQLMNNYEDDGTDMSSYWAYALNINVDDIVYVHCHQNRGEDTGGTIILVGPDGVQRPPIHFPEGGHMQAFLSCLETGLLPHGQLDPPLWSQRGIGNMFPWPRSMRRRVLPSLIESQEEVPIDYVFRVVSKSYHQEFLATHPILEIGIFSPRRKHLSSCSTTGSSECSTKSLSVEQSGLESPLNHGNQTASIELVCTSMRRQIISRAFYGWLAYCRHLSTVRTHLSGLVNGRITLENVDGNGLTKEKWQGMHENGILSNSLELFRSVYFGGVDADIRKEVWPYLLGHYSFGSTIEEREKQNETCKHYYETTMSEWLAVEAIVRQREKEKNAEAVARFSAEKNRLNNSKFIKHVANELDEEECPLENDVFEDNDFSDMSDFENDIEHEVSLKKPDHTERENESSKKCSTTDSGNGEDANDDLENKKHEPKIVDETENVVAIEQDNCFNDCEELETPGQFSNILMVSIKSSPSTSSYETVGNEFVEVLGINSALTALEDGFGCEISKCSTPITSAGGVCGTRLVKYHSADDVHAAVNNYTSTGLPHAVIIYEAASMDVLPSDVDTIFDTSRKTSILSPLNEDITVVASLDALQEPKSACVSPASSNGGVYSSELLENFGLNLHRIEKDVQRCDRNYWYFANENLDKLRNVISTYVWEHLEVGYMQGMCDLVAPLLVIFDDESLTYSCFCKLMERMIENFPNGGAMDMHFANMRSLIQILDSEMYDLMDSNGDYTHFYFCYRWFLLDFKRELVYDDVFTTWEVIWAAKHVASANFVLFLALALLETYRDIILSNSMDFTDVIKFFNEMAERHNASGVLQLARSLVLQLQMIIENK